MAAADLARKVMRDVRNRFSYEEVENYVRDATSNTADPPNPRQIRQIAETMLYYDTYPKAFGMLWRRLTHLEYKRHVAKALLVLDSLVRIRPPSKAVQLRLMVDIRERWPEIYRLAKLRPSSSSETIAQIQRVAERLCAFIMGYESGYIQPEEEEDEEEAERRKKRRVKRKKKKKTTTIEEEVEDDEEGKEEQPQEEEAEDDGEDSEGDLDHSLQQDFNSQPQQKLPPVSPFGFDFRHSNFEWTPPPGGAGNKPTPVVTASNPLPSPAGWLCRTCTFKNTSMDSDACEMCGSARYADMADDLKAEEEEKKADETPPGWACEACSFINREEADHCEVCETKRGLPAPLAIGEVDQEGEVPGAEVEEEKEAGPGSPLGGSQLPGAWACSFCSWLNSPTASHCEVCEREATRSQLAQLVKLQMAQRVAAQQEEAAGAQGGVGGSGAQPWVCSTCTRVNPATRVSCAGCGSQSPYATELMLTGGAGAAYSSAAPSPSLSPKSRRASALMPIAVPVHGHLHPHLHGEGELGGVDSLAVPEPGPGSHLQGQRRTGFAQGHAEPSRRLEAVEEGKADEPDEETLRRREDLAHQMAALEHYKKQREAYKAQYGWTCEACTMLNDPNSTKCEVCQTPRPALTATQQQAQAHIVAQQPRMAEPRQQAAPASSQTGPAQVKQQPKPTLPSSQPPAQAAPIVARVPAPSSAIGTSPSSVVPGRGPAPAPAAAAASRPTQPVQPQPQVAASKPALPSSMPVASGSFWPAPVLAQQNQPRLQVAAPSPSISISAPIPVSRPAAAASSLAPSRAAPGPDVIPQPKLADWNCDVCTYLNGYADPNCIMCNAPKPTTISVANQATEADGRSGVSAAVVSQSPLIPSNPPPSVPVSLPSSQPSASSAANPRRATQPLPQSRPTSEPSPPSSALPKRFSVLDGVSPSTERGPAIRPGELPFPPQYQQAAAAQALQADMARRDSLAREAAQAEQKARAQHAFHASAAAALQSLPPLSSPSPPLPPAPPP